MGNFDSDAIRLQAAAPRDAVADRPEPAEPSPGNPGGLTVSPRFCPAEAEDPFDTVEWEMRTATIKGENGEIIFQQDDCEVPACCGCAPAGASSGGAYSAMSPLAA